MTRKTKWIGALLVIVILCGIKFTNPWFLDVISLKGLDSHQRQQQTEIIDNIVTVEINNDTLAEYGQWPFPRGQLAEEVHRLYSAGAGLVVLPMLFAEPDRFGEDDKFTEMLMQTPTIIGQVPGNVTRGTPVTRGVSAVGAPWEGWLYRYPGAVGPLKEFAEAAIGVGMMIIAPEKDGVVRRVPLAVDIDGEIYPSMSMEIIRAASGDISYQIKTSVAGVEALRIPKYGITKTDSNGNIWIDFKYKTEVYPLQEALPDLSGKIVILSLTASGLDSVVATPVGNMYSHDLLAAAATTMMSGRNITRPYWTNLAELGGTFLLSLMLCIVVLKLRWYFGAILMPIFIGGSYYTSYYLFVKESYLIDWTYPVATIFIVWATSAFLRFMEEFKLRQQIKKQFETYLDPRQVAILQKDPSKLKLGGERKEMSFLFMDIVGFTPISEHYKNNNDPEGLCEVINNYLDRMTKIVLQNGGTIDKYMGDCIMAFWNAPLDCENHAEMAVKTSIECARETEKMKSEFKDKGLPDINIGSGVNTGTCIVGNMGSSTRFDYSVIGDAVNLAARLEAQTRNYPNCTTLLSQFTKDNIDILCEKLDEIKVKGKEELITIYQPIGD